MTKRRSILQKFDKRLSVGVSQLALAQEGQDSQAL